MYKILGEEMAAELKAKDAPGVFSQGLVVYSGAGDEVLFERLLDADIVTQVAEFCAEQGISLIAYSGDRIVSATLKQFYFYCIVYCTLGRSAKTGIPCRFSVQNRY